ncbi:allantoinase AllB [Solibacillus sp. FSL K6-1523]|uniref:allantoinase AllB n=1 Tax=Solibacillus sp. FSL K6-1523 TaxID=2921471 RepID=UPI0030F9DF4A
MINFDVVIKGKIVLPNEVIDGEIGVLNGKIEAIERSQGSLIGNQIIDAIGQIILPGVIDGHVHAFSNPEEGLIATTSAAAAGGVTTIIDMPYDLPNPVNNIAAFSKKVDLVEKEVIVDTCLWGTIAKENGAEAIDDLAKAGACAFKMSTFETDSYRFPRISDVDILKAMNKLKEYDLVAAFHAENDEMIVDLIDELQEEGKVYPKAHMESRPPVTETTAVLKLMELSYWADAKLHIVHVSHPRTISLIQQFKKQGVKVTAETCYPYLLLSVNDLEKFGPKAKNNPPLRYEEDVQGLWKQLMDEEIDFITTDHAPWKAEQKERGVDNIFLAASGMPGLDIMVPLMYEAAVKENGMAVEQFAKIMSQNVADIYGIPNKGRIEVGYDADFTIIDPSKPYIIEEKNLHSNSKLTPFDGVKVDCSIAKTIVRGVMVFDGADIKVGPGFGKFVPGKAYKESSLIV